MKYTKLVSLLAAATMLLVFAGQASAERHVRDRDADRYQGRVHSNKNHDVRQHQGRHYQQHKHAYKHGYKQGYKHGYKHHKPHYYRHGHKHWKHHARSYYSKPYRSYYKRHDYRPHHYGARAHHGGLNLILRF